jgi:hypothetical protein
MSDPAPIPIILLAFANDKDDHLNMLTKERWSISEALGGYEDKRYIRLKEEPDASAEILFKLFNRFDTQVAIFHYGGHANGNALDLETESGGNEAANAVGLAKRMGLSSALQLVFLNGCATAGQVRALIENGVKAVIATQVPVDDTMATEFAEQFYQGLASAKTIKESFDAACAFVATKDDHPPEIGEFRGMSWGDQPEPAGAGLAWGLYVHPQGESALAWKLPEQAENEVIVRGAALTAKAGVPVNDGLVQILFNALAPYSMAMGISLEMAKRGQRLDMRELRQQIIDAFPSPVGEQVRKLFANNTIDEIRLRQLVLTYETISKLFCFALVSQLWNALYDNPAMLVSPAEWTAIESFQSLDEAKQRSFDYLAFVRTIGGILKANQVAPFMTECLGLDDALVDAESDRAHVFMEELRALLAGASVAPAEVESFCVQAETHLGVLLSDMAFLVAYKLATIKGIAIQKTRHKPPEFRHRQVVLDRVTAPFVDVDEIRAAYTDNESVILLKDLEDVSQYLNLTPFVIDQNALTGNENPKIYFYSHRDPAQDSYHYYSILDATDRLAIGDGMAEADRPIYLPIKGLMEEFRQTVKRP